jgi:hypothetical protein
VADELVQLAMSGGSALLAAVATDAWEAVKPRVARLFSRAGDRRKELVCRWLDESATALDQADAVGQDVVRRQQAAIWQGRLSDFLEEFPEAADELDRLIEQIRAELPVAAQQWMQQTNLARDRGIVFGVQGGSQHVHYYGDSPADRDGTRDVGKGR